MRALCVSCVVIILASCSGGGGGGSSQTPSTVALEKISLTPYVTQLALGTSVTLSATGIYSDQTTKDVGDTASWSIDDLAVLGYDDSGDYGKIDAVGVGATRVRVSVGDIHASLELTVSPATLEKLTVSPPRATLPAGAEIPLEVTGFFSDDSSQTITQSISWTIDNPSVIRVVDGYLVALSQGESTVTATYGGVHYTVTMNVSDAVLTSIELSPAFITMASGLSMGVQVTGIYSDNSKRDVTSLIGWDSTDGAIASVSLAGDRAALTGYGPGNVTLTAWLGSASATSSVTITQAELSRIEISIGEDDLPKGLTRQIRATGIYTDNTTKDVTAMVLWQSSDDDVAVISNASGSKGLLSAIAMGTTRVSAHAGDASATADVTVGSAIIQKLQVSAGFRALPAGLTRGLQAQGLYSDQSLRDVTKDVTWVSSDTRAAVVGNCDGKGMVTGVVPGPVSISAHMGGLTSSLSITITDAILMSLEISPDSVSVAAGQAQQFAAIGLYSDQTTSDVTKEVLWGSQDRDVAVPDNSHALSGMYQTLAEGASEVTAVLDGVTGSSLIQVTAAELINIFMTTPSITLEKGMSQGLSVTGLYTDSTTRNISDTVLWESDAPDIVRVENNPEGKGTIYALAQGKSRIYATIDDLETLCDVSVKAAGIEHIGINESSVSLAAGTSAQLSVTGYFNDGSERDLTDSVLWESSDAHVADVSNTDGENGLLRAYVPGTATLTASCMGRSDSVTVSVSEATLVSIEILPADDSLPSGLSLQYQAVGHFSDASEQDLTQRAIWEVDEKNLAAISNIVGLKGRLYTFAPGAVTVSGRFGDATGQATLTITGENLVAVRLAPSPCVIEDGKTSTMVLEGVFSDYSVRDLSAEAVWISTNILVASVSNADGNEGVMTGQSVGQARVLAIYSNLGFVAPVYVIDALVMDIEQVAGGLQFYAYGAVGPDQYINLTERVAWNSANESVLIVSNEEGEEGFGQPVQPGSSIVTAEFSDTLSVSRSVVLSSGE